MLDNDVYLKKFKKITNTTQKTSKFAKTESDVTNDIKAILLTKISKLREH